MDNPETEAILGTETQATIHTPKNGQHRDTGNNNTPKTKEDRDTGNNRMDNQETKALLSTRHRQQ